MKSLSHLADIIFPTHDKTPRWLALAAQNLGAFAHASNKQLEILFIHF